MAAESPANQGGQADRPSDVASGFGDVLFGELKQVAMRRGDLASLAAARARLGSAAGVEDRTGTEHELAGRWRGAAAAVRDLVAIVGSHAESVGWAKDSPGRADLDRELRKAEECLARAASDAGTAGLDGDRAARVAGAVDRVLEGCRLALRAGARVEAFSVARRQAQGDEKRLEDDEAIADRAREAAIARDLVGLAFSGGGIRSATFNLGVLQGLASSGLLETFDYLSTVSGGGYIGAWLAAWVHRERDLENVGKQLQPMRTIQAGALRGWPEPEPAQDGRATSGPAPGRGEGRVRGVVEEEPEPIYHLRRYSNYLAPTTGLLSIDTWSMLSTYARNLLLNQLVLLPAAVALVLVPRLSLPAFRAANGDVARGLLGLAMLLFAGTSLVAMYGFLLARRWAAAPPGGDPLDPIAARLAKWAHPGLRWFIGYVVVPLFAAAVLFAYAFSSPAHDGLHIPPFDPLLSRDSRIVPRIPRALVFGVLAGVLRLLWFLVSWLPWLLGWAVESRGADGGGRARSGVGWIELAQRALFSFLAATAGATCLYAVMSWLRAGLSDASGWLEPTMAAFGPPAAVLAILLSTSIESGLLGAAEEEEIREWRASLGAYLMLGAVAWAVIFGISLYGPLLIAAAGWLASAVLGTGWLATSISGVLAGRSALTQGGRGGPWENLAKFAPPVFVVGLLVLVSNLACLPMGVEIPASLGVEDVAPYWGTMEGVGVPTYVLAVLAAMTVAGTVCWRLNVNLFSLHAFYANRLVRCYLGASRPEGTRPPGRPHYAPSNCPPPARHPNLVTGFDREDDIPLKDLKAFTDGAVEEGDAGLARGYRGPFPLLNTALNLVAGQELAWQERMAESFVLTPLYSGSKSTGYRRMDGVDPGDGGGERPGYGGELRLGTAVSISGAAASPNMGYHTSPAVAFLMTVFNARLGWWLGNPALEAWREPGPRWGFYLFKELFGRTNARSRYVYLSDGGHFENLGVYELIRRRCRYIVACDAGEDPALAFWDLGSLVRKCREDLGVRIEIDIAPLLKQEGWGKSRWHCSIGRIHYDDIDVAAIPGVLLYIKPSLTGDEPTDIRNYVVDHPDFPHQPTVNQFFSESQFESYRALGEHIALEVFREVARAGGDRASAGAMFAALRRRWFPPPPDFDANFLKSVDAYIKMQGQLRIDPNLARLTAELYPETVTDAEGGDARARAEVHAIAQVLQVMEDVWLTVGLENFAEHPMNRGWMNWFRRWTGTEVFQRLWPALRGEFSQDFVRFAEKQLNLRVAPPSLIRYPGPGADGLAFVEAAGRLDAEYALEWPNRPWPGGVKDRPVRAGGDGDGSAGNPGGGLLDLLDHAIGCAKGRSRDGMIPAWLVPEPSRPGVAAGRPAWNGRACGIILAWPVRDDDLAREVFELFVWFRGPYRTQGIAGGCIAAAIDEIRRRFVPDGGGFTLRVDYPMRDLSGSSDRWQSLVWLGFFQGLGFRKKRPEAPGQEVLSLYRDEPGVPQADGAPRPAAAPAPAVAAPKNPQKRSRRRHR